MAFKIETLVFAALGGPTDAESYYISYQSTLAAKVISLFVKSLGFQYLHLPTQWLDIGTIKNTDFLKSG